MPDQHSNTAIFESQRARLQKVWISVESCICFQSISVIFFFFFAIYQALASRLHKTKNRAPPRDMQSSCILHWLLPLASCKNIWCASSFARAYVCGSMRCVLMRVFLIFCAHIWVQMCDFFSWTNLLKSCTQFFIRANTFSISAEFQSHCSAHFQSKTLLDQFFEEFISNATYA